MIRTGLDLVEIERVEATVDRFGDRFLRRIYTEAELAICNGRSSSLAARFAAKEAVAKALGTGIWRCGIEWTDIEILNDPVSREPHLVLHGAAATRAGELGVSEWSVSLTHARDSAVAFTVAIGNHFDV
jgi:holo-[acyl-carrier protein] synthase